jgi:hypothetical protein
VYVTTSKYLISSSRFNVILSYGNFSEFESHMYLLERFLFIVAKEEGDPRSSLPIFSGV